VSKKPTKPLSVSDVLDVAVDAIGGKPRSGQLEMAQEVFNALENRNHLIVQAGTGTGKSLAYLVPSLMRNKPVLIATATLALQRQLVERDLPRVVPSLVQALGREISYAVYKGKGNYLCLQKMNTSLPDPDGDLLLEIGTLSAEAKKLREWAETPGVSGDKDDAPVVDRRVWVAHSVSGRECIGAEVCVFGDKCFSEKAKQKAGTADIVVTNHTLLAIEIVDKHPILPDRDAIILDEGHEFADRTTQAVTEELTANMANRAAAMARRHTPGVESDKLTDACNNLADSIEDFQIMAKVSDDDSVGGRIEELPTMVFHSLTAIRESAYNYLALLASDNEATDGDLLAERARVKGAVTEVHTTAGKLLKAGEKDVMWFDPAVGALRLAPLSVSQVLRSNMLTQTPVIVTSATLTVGGGFDAIANAIGFLPKIDESSSEQIDPENFVALDVGSPFDFATQGMLYLPTSLPEPGREGPSSELLNELGDLIEAAGGRTLALFSSWRGVEAADAYLRKYLAERKDIKIITQRKGDSVGVLVDQFASDHKSILIGTISLWQGVDVPGASCSLVVIDRIPFPRPDDPVMSARAAKVDAAGGSGFMQVSVPKAALLLAQGAGRLIRSMEDKGVVAILDTRITSKRYGSVLLRSMPPFWRTNDKAIVLDSLKRLNQSFN
jgi:ATP-dependent DNA helicase DinG